MDQEPKPVDTSFYPQPDGTPPAEPIASPPPQAPNPPEASQAAPPEPQSPQPQAPSPQPNQAPPEKSNTTKIVLIACGVLLVVFLAFGGLIAASVLTGVNGSRSKAKDARLKGYVSQLRSEAELYYDEHSTYQGWQVSNEIGQEAQALGSGIGTRTSATEYVIYTHLTTSKNVYCADSSGITKEIPKAPTGTKCQ